MDNCTSPAIITKDLAMLVYGRDGRLGPRLKHLFQGTFRNPEANKLIGVYEITMKRLAIGSPGNIFISYFTCKAIYFPYMQNGLQLQWIMIEFIFRKTLMIPL